MKHSFTTKQYISFATVGLMLVIWKLLSIKFDSDFILPSPEKTFLTTINLFGDINFLSVVGSTVFRGILGFIISAILGVGLGVIAGISPNFNAFLKPILVVIRSTPIIALILLALIWLSPGSVPVFIAMLTMFPFIRG